jgi:hypothetical protein
LLQRLPPVGVEAAPDAPATTLRMHAAAASLRTRDRRRNHLAVWAVAASLAVAAWGVVTSRNLKSEVAALDKKAQGAAAELLADKKSRVAELEQAERSPYLVGESTDDWAALADSTVSEALVRGGLRGGPDLTDEDAEAISRAKDELFAAAQEYGLLGLPGRLEYAAALIKAARLEEAERVLEEIEVDASATPGTLAQWRNLRGTLLATRAADSSMTVAEPLMAEAEALFRQAAEGGLNEAWLNLAMLLLEQGEAAEAEEALQTYRAGVANSGE